MTEWLIASNNKFKTLDLQKDLEFFGLNAAQYTDFFEPVKFPDESTDSYKNNATNKATFLSNKILRPVISDDSGIEIPALPNALGVTTKRELHQDKAKSDNQTLLDLMADLSEDRRTATMITYLAAVDPKGRVITAKGEVTGLISREDHGDHSSGFDKIFYLPELGKTLAELPDEERIPLTHRGRAAKNLIQLIKDGDR
ncbi:non-canonical purine NTP pyrophosphatase [Companilactobacillus zhongbaensis]|uniref:non-canonical purine NTP pyrophosphatase n=1 Tax=Companilactobacillus zhongbaensis TaxID=2486009 RepID=UPI000F7A9B44|nr:non-canonical purine NTP pyrophosphatase [Companilactobacillus zhongbaensis]